MLQNQITEISSLSESESVAKDICQVRISENSPTPLKSKSVASTSNNYVIFVDSESRSVNLDTSIVEPSDLKDDYLQEMVTDTQPSNVEDLSSSSTCRVVLRVINRLVFTFLYFRCSLDVFLVVSSLCLCAAVYGVIKNKSHQGCSARREET